jgi:uncharacterized membrane protein
LLFLIFLLFLLIMQKKEKLKDGVLNVQLLIVLSSLTFLWYSLSVSQLVYIKNLFSVFYQRFFSDIFSINARSQQALVSQTNANLSNSVTSIIFILLNGFIALGIIIVILKPRLLPNLRYRHFIMVGAALMVTVIIVPNLAASINITRFYSLGLLFLAPCLVIGFNWLLNLSPNKIFKNKLKWRHCNFFSASSVSVRGMFLGILIVIFFLTQSGLINHFISPVPLVRPVEIDRLRATNNTQVMSSFYSSYIPIQDVYGAMWLSTLGNSHFIVYADDISRGQVLASYGLIPLQRVFPLNNITSLIPNSYLYLSFLTLKTGQITSGLNFQVDLSSLSFSEENCNIIYSNGNTQILRPVGPYS